MTKVRARGGVAHSGGVRQSSANLASERLTVPGGPPRAHLDALGRKRSEVTVRISIRALPQRLVIHVRRLSIALQLL